MSTTQWEEQLEVFSILERRRELRKKARRETRRIKKLS